MTSKFLNISILTFLIVGIILIIGCTPNVEMLKESSTCPSPYDGTYRGLVSGSGEKGEWIDGEYVTTPYIISYDLEVTLKCEGISPCVNNDNQQCWGLVPTHAKVSDPFFGCTQGCTPIVEGAFIQLPKPGESGGAIDLQFPNGAYLFIVPILAGPDAKKISADQTKHKEVITSVLGLYSDLSDEIREATFKCYPPRYCYWEQQGFTAYLDKIS